MYLQQTLNIVIILIFVLLLIGKERPLVVGQEHRM